jgi:hypothetical protein
MNIILAFVFCNNKLGTISKSFYEKKSQGTHHAYHSYDTICDENHNSVCGDYIIFIYVCICIYIFIYIYIYTIHLLTSTYSVLGTVLLAGAA